MPRTTHKSDASASQRKITDMFSGVNNADDQKKEKQESIDENGKKNAIKSTKHQFPVSFDIFCKFTYYDEVVDKILLKKVDGNESKFKELASDKKRRKAIAYKYYKLFYTDLMIRKDYEIKLKPCPAQFRAKLLQFPFYTQIDENQIQKSENISKKRRENPTEVLEDENNYQSQRKRRRVLDTPYLPSNNNNNEKSGYHLHPNNELNTSQGLNNTSQNKYPVSFETFLNFTYYDEVVDKILLKKADGDEAKFKEWSKDENKRQYTAYKFYKEFYTNEMIRSEYKIRFKPCPLNIKFKLLQLPSQLRKVKDSAVEQKKLLNESEKSGGTSKNSLLQQIKKLRSLNDLKNEEKKENTSVSEILVKETQNLSKPENSGNVKNRVENENNLTHLKKSVRSLKKKPFENNNTSNSPVSSSSSEDQLHSEFPVTFETFFKYTNCKEIVERLLLNKWNGDFRQIKQLSQNTNQFKYMAVNLYKQFYLIPSIRNIYEIKIKPCSRELKKKILQIPIAQEIIFRRKSSYDSESIDDAPLPEKNGDTEVNSFAIDTSKQATNSTKINFPVEFSDFIKYTNCEEIIEHMLLQESGGNLHKFERFLGKSRKFKTIAYNFYKEFYLTPSIRNEYELKIKSCSDELKKKILQIPIPTTNALETYSSVDSIGDDNAVASCSRQQNSRRVTTNCDIGLKPCPHEPKEKMLQIPICQEITVESSDEDFTIVKNAQHTQVDKTTKRIRTVRKCELNDDGMSEEVSDDECLNSSVSVIVSSDDDSDCRIISQKCNVNFNTIERCMAEIHGDSGTISPIQTQNVNEPETIQKLPDDANKSPENIANILNEFESTSGKEDEFIIPVNLVEFIENTNILEIVQKNFEIHNDVQLNEAVYNFYIKFYTEPKFRENDLVKKLYIRFPMALVLTPIDNMVYKVPNTSNIVLDEENSRPIQNVSKECSVSSNCEAKLPQRSSQVAELKACANKSISNFNQIFTPLTYDFLKRFIQAKITDIAKHDEILKRIENKINSQNVSKNLQKTISNKVHIQSVQIVAPPVNAVALSEHFKTANQEVTASLYVNPLVTSENKNLVLDCKNGSKLPESEVDMAKKKNNCVKISPQNKSTPSSAQTNKELETKNLQNQNLISLNLEGKEIISSSQQNNSRSSTIEAVPDQVKYFDTKNLDSFEENDFYNFNDSEIAKVNTEIDKSIKKVNSNDEKSKHVERLEKPVNLFFEKYDKCFSFPYIMRSCATYKQQILKTILKMSFEEFRNYTQFYEKRDMYEHLESLNECYRYAITNEKIWPVNLFMRVDALVAYLNKNLTIQPLELDDISPKLLHWSDLIVVSNFDDSVREYFLYVGRTNKEDENKAHPNIESEFFSDEMTNKKREIYYKKCWVHDKWLLQTPKIKKAAMRNKKGFERNNQIYYGDLTMEICEYEPWSPFKGDLSYNGRDNNAISLERNTGKQTSRKLQISNSAKKSQTSNPSFVENVVNQLPASPNLFLSSGSLTEAQNAAAVDKSTSQCQNDHNKDEEHLSIMSTIDRLPEEVLCIDDPLNDVKETATEKMTNFLSEIKIKTEFKVLDKLKFTLIDDSDNFMCQTINDEDPIEVDPDESQINPADLINVSPDVPQPILCSILSSNNSTIMGTKSEAQAFSNSGPSDDSEISFPLKVALPKKQSAQTSVTVNIQKVVQNVPQLTHTFRPLVLTKRIVNTNEEQPLIDPISSTQNSTASNSASSLTSTKSNTQLTHSQLLTKDNTIFNNTTLLRASNQQEETIDRRKSQNPNLQQQVNTNNNQPQISNVENMYKIVLYRNLKKFLYFERLTQSNVVDHELPIMCIGQRYMQAQIIRGKATCLCGDILQTLFYNYSKSILNDVRHVLTDLNEFYYNAVDFKTIHLNGDLRVRTLYYFLHFSSKFCLFNMKFDCISREYAQVTENLPNGNQSTVTGSHQQNPLISAISPDILDSIVALKNQL